MTLEEFNELTKDLPKDMSICLCDLTTDAPYDGSYDIEKSNVSVEDTYEHEDDEEPIGKCLVISFENKLNPNPIKLT